MPPSTDQDINRLVELPPLIITCALTGEHQKSENPNLPVTLEEQVESAAAAMDAGAAIIHVHGRDPDDPTKPARATEDYRAIAAAIRARRPDAIVDFTQPTVPLEGLPGQNSNVHRYSDVTLQAGPEIMSLSAGPMTFRGGGGKPSSVIATSFDDTARAASELREHGIKPQVFLYHPGHLDLLQHLIEFDLLSRPYWIQLVFGQQSGIPATPEGVLFMTRSLPAGCLFQCCALGLDSIEVALMAIVLGGHVRTGMEDALLYRSQEPARGNEQLVSRVARIATEVGRRVATPSDARRMLGIPAITS